MALRGRSQAAEDLAAKRAAKKVQTRGDALRRRRTTLNEFLYTVPYTPVAGQKVRGTHALRSCLGCPSSPMRQAQRGHFTSPMLPLALCCCRCTTSRVR